MAKIVVQKSDVITFTWLLGHWTARKKNWAWNVLRWLLVYSSILCIPFWISSKIWFCRYFFLRNRNFDFGGKKKTKKMTTRDSHFVERSIWHLLVFFLLRFASRLYILEPIESWPFFDPKSRDMTSLKYHFLKKLTDFAEILCVGVKLMWYKVL